MKYETIGTDVPQSFGGHKGAVRLPGPFPFSVEIDSDNLNRHRTVQGRIHACTSLQLFELSVR